MVVVVGVALALGLREATYSVPWFGPLAANSLRKLLGRDAVSRLEEASAALEDWWLRAWAGNRRPRAITEIERAPARPSAAPGNPEARAPDARRPPRDVGPMDPRVAASGDGAWRAVPDPVRPDERPALFTTLLHPDPKRAWAEAFIVTASLDDVRLHAVAGTMEPRATTAEGRGAVRPGLIPLAAQRQLLGVFNGGFKTEHGQHGMFVDGVTLVPARSGLCTVLGTDDGALRISTWEHLASELAEREEHASFWRQAAPCLVEGGRVHPGLRDETTRRWGAALAGETVIRRSAVGVDAGRSVLYVAITNATTALALAEAMLHAGATDVAQLDVNWSYPKFVMFPVDASGVRHAQSLFDGFPVSKDDFVRKPYPRDFFYLSRRSAEAE